MRLLFPTCSLRKEQCANSTECVACWEAFQSGQGATAARECATGDAAVDMDMLAQECVTNDPVGCAFWLQRCQDYPQCMSCFEAMGSAGSTHAIAVGGASDVCAEVRNSSTLAAGHIQNMFFKCPPSTFSACVRTVSSCALGAAPTCTQCLLGIGPSPDACDALLNLYNVNGACRPCPDSVATINEIVFATSAVGGVSVVACLWVVAAIVAYRRDISPMRDRIVVGLMLSNGVYSVTSAIPLNQLRADVANCGELALAFDTIRLGRGLWFGGKYAIVGCEIVILGMSAWALMRGTSVVRPWAEGALYLACGALGAVAFAAFYARCAAINHAGGYNSDTQMLAVTNQCNHASSEDDADDYGPGTFANELFDAGRSDNDALVRDMLVVWDCIVGAALLVWLWLLFAYRVVLRKWNERSSAGRKLRRLMSGSTHDAASGVRSDSCCGFSETPTPRSVNH